MAAGTNMPVELTDGRRQCVIELGVVDMRMMFDKDEAHVCADAGRFGK